MIARHDPSSSTSPWKGEVGREAAGRGSIARFSRTRAMTLRARRLRKDLTDSERKLWQALRRDQFRKLHFRRQHPIGSYVLDFYCPALRLAIELDGGKHSNEEYRARDERRTRWLSSKGIMLLRFWNSDVMSNFAGVLGEIWRIADARHSGMTPSLTLLLSGGGEE